MKMEIKLNDDTKMDFQEIMVGKLLLNANTGGGKSYATRRILEQSFSFAPQIILDTEGEFHTLREKFDYLLIGKDHDITADHKTAPLLAHRLIKERVSAIIDLFEMSPVERQLFVKNFVSAMTNAPHELWQPTLLMIDEAQTYAPEGDKTECGQVLHDAAFKFRKRNFGMIFATPRIASLSKSVISTCKNKLIGYASLENDVKRAAYELGFTTKDQWRSLRDLNPGEFFAFGPAISREVVRVQIGKVLTSHGQHAQVDSKVIAPSARVKKALAALADLPQAAEQEARTIAELTKENAKLKRDYNFASKVKTTMTDPELFNKAKEKAIKEALHQQEKVFWKQRDEWLKHINSLFKVIETIGKTALAVKKPELGEMPKPVSIPTVWPQLTIRKDTFDTMPTVKVEVAGEVFEEGIQGPEQKILNSIAWCESIGNMYPPQELVAFLSGYSHVRSSGFRNPRGSLKVKGMINYEDGKIELTSYGRDFAERNDAPLTTERLHEVVLDKLDGPERKLLEPLLQAYPDGISNTELAAMSGYSHERSSGYRNPRGRLKTFGLIDYSSNGVKAKEILFL